MSSSPVIIISDLLADLVMHISVPVNAVIWWACPTELGPGGVQHRYGCPAGLPVACLGGGLARSGRRCWSLQREGIDIAGVASTRQCRPSWA